MRRSLFIKNLLFQIGFINLCSKIFRSGTTAILRYHSIVNPEDNYYASPSICITPVQFEKQVYYLSTHCNIISLDRVADCIINQNPFPKKSVVLTFDDGYRDNYYAYQILKKYNAQGTFYLSAGCIGKGETLWLFEVIYLIRNTTKADLCLQVNGKKSYFLLSSQGEKNQAIQKVTEIIKSNNLEVRENIRAQLKDQIDDVLDLEKKASTVMLTWEQVQEMNDNGMAIGGHTMTHLNLPNALPKDALREINDCKKILQKKLGIPICHFSYPNGGNYDYYNKSIKKMVKEANYTSSTTSNNGVVNLKSDLFELRRLRVTENLSEIVYQMNCEQAINKIRGK